MSDRYKKLREILLEKIAELQAYCSQRGNGRVRWDFMNRIKMSFMNFRYDLNLKIDATEESISRAIDKAFELKRQGTVEMEKAQALLLQDLDQIKQMKTDLQGLHNSLEVL